MNQIVLRHIEDTRKLGLCMAGLVKAGDILLLSGDLGAGKTTLTRFLAQGLGIDEREVTSPTFSIIHEYRHGRIPVAHVDLYRLGKNAEISDIGLDEYLAGDFIIIMEWAEFLPESIGKDCLYMNIRMDRECKTRTVTFRQQGQSWKERLAELERCMKQH